MRIEDANAFKGKVKTAMQKWGEAKINELFSGSATMRMFAKNGLNNAMSRYDAKMDEGIENLFMFVSKDGVVDSDVMVDGLAKLLQEMQPGEYRYGGVGLIVGGGEIALELPRNIFLDMLVGAGRLRFTSDDVLELKNLFN